MRTDFFKNLKVSIENSQYYEPAELLNLPEYQSLVKNAHWTARTINDFYKRGVLLGKYNSASKCIEINETSFRVLAMLYDTFKECSKTGIDYTEFLNMIDKSNPKSL